LLFSESEIQNAHRHVQAMLQLCELRQLTGVTARGSDISTVHTAYRHLVTYPEKYDVKDVGVEGRNILK